jgi:hypothetical protein
MKNVFFLLLLSFGIVSCENKSTTNQSSDEAVENSSSAETSSETPTDDSKSEISNSGVYTYKDNSTELQITVSGNRWMGKTVIVSGFGAEYDNQNAQYDNGIINGNDLYESSGNIKIGYIDGNSLVATVFDRQVTLRK